MSNHLDPEHENKRRIVRAVGPIVLVTGLVFTVIGLGSFFSALGSFEQPRYFWCAFIGLPLMAIGGAICKFAFMGLAGRFIANEVAPVGKDVANYMADGTKDAVRDVATAIGEGLSSAQGGREVSVVRCQKCNADNEADSNFCKSCGAGLRKSVACSDCGELNDADARFCDNCGTAVVS